jgi:5-methylcytosine-specific restriction endonuclease McrA
MCRRAKYLEVKRRYQQSEKGQVTARAREEREDVKEKRRQLSRSPQGRLNKAKYEATEKGQITRKKAILKYKLSGKGKQAAAERHQKTKDLLSRIAQKRQANSRYIRTEKGKANKRRDYARRKDAIVPDRPVTAEDWLEIVAQHKNRCYYCKKKRILTLDHVIPISKGGLHVKENIVPACRSCNSKKKDRLILIC